MLAKTGKMKSSKSTNSSKQPKSLKKKHKLVKLSKKKSLLVKRSKKVEKTNLVDENWVREFIDSSLNYDYDENDDYEDEFFNISSNSLGLEKSEVEILTPNNFIDKSNKKKDKKMKSSKLKKDVDKFSQKNKSSVAEKSKAMLEVVPKILGQLKKATFNSDNDSFNPVKLKQNKNSTLDNNEISFNNSLKEDSDLDSLNEQSNLLDSSLEIEDQTMAKGISYKFQQLSNQKVLCLNKNATIYLYGVVRIKLLHGTIEILGHIINSDCNKSYDIFSPKGTSFLSIINRTTENSNILSTNNYEALITCEKITNFSGKLLESLETFEPQRLFPKPAENDENNLQCVFRDAENDWPVFKTGPKWYEIAEKLTGDCKLVITGDKGVGKSTMLRFLLNRMLNRFEKVVFVDLDPGQPEFTVSGCVSISVITEPIFGPNYTHLRTPNSCFFVPNVNIKENIDDYLSSVKHLLNTLSLLPNTPILINYMGYTRGIGQQLVSTIITLIQPTDVVQLHNSDSNYNYTRLLTPDSVNRDAVLLNNGDCCEQPVMTYKLWQVDSVKKGGGSSFELQPRKLRQLSVVTYLSQVLTGGGGRFLTDVTVRVFVATLSKVKILDNFGNENPVTANANLVALCNKVTTEATTNIYNCLGWGVVRGVSTISNKVYLISPIDQSLIESITHLIVGSVHLPTSFYTNTSSKLIGPMPYVEEGKQSTFSLPAMRQLYKFTKK